LEVTRWGKQLDKVGSVIITIGSFGKVKLSYHTFTGQVVAIKIIDKIHAPVVYQEVPS
jgi:serine/threonine protein kinase